MNGRCGSAWPIHRSQSDGYWQTDSRNAATHRSFPGSDATGLSEGLESPSWCVVALGEASTRGRDLSGRRILRDKSDRRNHPAFVRSSRESVHGPLGLEWEVSEVESEDPPIL